MKKIKLPNSSNENLNLSRRQFVQGAAMGAGGLMLGAFSGSQASAQKPNRGGTLRIGLGHGTTTDTIDPGKANNDFLIFTNYCNRGHLTEVAPNGDLVGDIAESFEPSADAKTWHFKLRKDVEFHNGKTVTTADVIASFRHHMGEATSSTAKSILAEVKDIRADGSDGIVFELAGGNADFAFVASDYHFAIMPAKDDGSVDWESGIGTGAYKLENFEPGVRADYSRYPNFYKENAGFFDGVEVHALLDVNARQSALQSGVVDMIDRVDLKTADRLARVNGIEIFETSGTGHYTIPMDVRAAPFNDPNVRLALKHALDREALLQTILFGHGKVGNDHPISEVNRYHNGEMPQKSYDPDKAKFYLGKAGLTELAVDLHVADAAFAGATDAAVLYQQQANTCGVNINVVRQPNDGYWSNIWMKEPWTFSYWGGRPTEDWAFNTAYAPGGTYNETFWANPRFSELLVAARSELDDAKRREMYYEMQVILSDDGGAIIPVFNNYVDGVSDRLQIPETVAVNWPHDGHKCAERWWFKA